MRKQSAESPVVHQSDQRLTHTLARMRRTPKGDSRKVMHYTNHQSTPVFSSDGQPPAPTTRSMSARNPWYSNTPDNSPHETNKAAGAQNTGGLCHAENSHAPALTDRPYVG